VAQKIADEGVDIAVDLMGLTANAPTEIFARRPAPVQLNYLGYPGTTGADFMDYILADAVVAPLSQQEFYAEKILHLPDCYQPNDSNRPLPPAHLSLEMGRAEAGLPAHGFVFCCFNNSWKINPPLFDIWMRLLKSVPGSVLWLIEDNQEAAANLRRAAAARGMAEIRLVFAPRVASEAHLARHRLADLFLDTLPYNAHTTASDALWTGVPLITVLGEGFAGRVAASLLSAVGLPELIAENLDDYEKLALALARDPASLAGLKKKLEANRLIAPLFDTARFTRNLEAAYEKMRDAFLARG
jgi:predicted O-linked N-acetylglucosamine transferase (SPINDLY family)